MGQVAGNVNPRMKRMNTTQATKEMMWQLWHVTLKMRKRERGAEWDS